MTNKNTGLQISLHDQFMIGAIAGLVASGHCDAPSIISNALNMAKAITQSIAIDWSKAPKDANFHAVDENTNLGSWFDVKPFFKNGMWYAGKDARLASKAPSFGIEGGVNAIAQRGEK